MNSLVWLFLFSFGFDVSSPPLIPGFLSMQATDADLQEHEAGSGWYHILRLIGALRDGPRFQVRELQPRGYCTMQYRSTVLL